MVGFDLETTSADPEEARIVSATVIAVQGRNEPESFSTLVNPGVPIPPGATEVNGITDEMVKDAPGSKEALHGILAMLHFYTKLGVPLVAFNARYDLTVADRVARRVGEVPLQDREGPLYVIDPHVIDKEIDRYRPGKRTLEAMCQRYRARLDGAHDAANDAISAARCAWVLGAKGVVIRRTRNATEQAEYDEVNAQWTAAREDLATLHETQRKWAERQAIDLAHYFVRVGNIEKAEQVVAAWPIYLREG
jgi:DNA polymerase-3 subunit epsilon